MNRKQKIMVSIVAILIVTLTLIGITYAYFLTRINGNTNTKSIEVTTADLRLEYFDGTVEILSKSNIKPGDVIGSKDFTVTNKGESKVNGYIVYLEDIVNTFTNTNDVVYTLTCTSSDTNPCNGISETVYPIDNTIIVTNDIEPNVVHSYVLTVKYKETNTDQSVDMNKTIKGKVNIYDAKGVNPYDTGSSETNNSSLTYNIINNSISTKNGTSLVGSTATKIAEEISGTNEKVLSLTKDDYGTSYYYRGNVTDNYVNFANMCFRIVRINGDGSVKLVLADKDNVCNASDYSTTNTTSSFIGTGVYAYQTSINSVSNLPMPDLKSIKADWTDSTSANDLLYNWYQSKLKSYESKLKNENWNVGNYTDYTTYQDQYIFKNYYSLTRDYDISLLSNTNDSKYESYYGLLNANELAFAGMSTKSYNKNTYLWNNANGNYWTFTNSHSAASGSIIVLFISGVNGNITSEDELNAENTQYNYDNNINIRPSVILKSGISISSGNGTIENPYVIN